jgi:hypothetical protein
MRHILGRGGITGDAQNGDSLHGYSCFSTSRHGGSSGRSEAPPRADQYLQTLMNRNTNGALTSAERDELDALVELSESIAIVRAKALHLLGRAPE